MVCLISSGVISVSSVAIFTPYNIATHGQQVSAYLPIFILGCDQGLAEVGSGIVMMVLVKKRNQPLAETSHHHHYFSNKVLIYINNNFCAYVV
jgi:hypothetical protein